MSAGPFAIKAVEPLQKRDEIGDAFGLAHVRDQPPSGVIERSHHRNLLGLAGRRNAQIGPTLGPSSGQIGMRQRLALVDEEQHVIAGLRLRLAQRQPEADAVGGVGVLAPLQAMSRPTPTEFFSQRLGQAGFGDGDAFTRLDLADEARQRPVGAVVTGASTNGSAQRGFGP